MNQIELMLSSIVGILQLILRALTPTATQPIIKNVQVTAANTETRWIMPLNVRAFTFKARGGDIQLALSQGESTVEFITILNGSAWSEHNIDTYFDGIFFQSTNAAAVLEVILWRA